MASFSRVADPLRVPAAPASVGVARQFVHDRLVACGATEDLVDTAVLLASELVTNAVLHASSEIVVDVAVGPSVEQGVRVEVRDRNVQVPVRRRHDRESVTGRGLELVETLASGYGVEPIPEEGKAVWFTLGASPVASGWGRVDSVSVHPVELRHLPVVLYEVMRDQNESLIREYVLHRVGSVGSSDATVQEISAAERARQVVAGAVTEQIAQHRGGAGDDSAVSSADSSVTHLDVRVDVALECAPAFALLGSVFRDAEALAVEGHLLTRPALPEIRAVREWVFGEVVRQLAGEPPRPWTYEDAPPTEGLRAPDVDTSWVEDSTDAVIVGDDGNHILAVSKPAARALGWHPDDLVGQRIVTVVPPRLREAHIAGFTRQLVTGRANALIGREVVLPALHRDGHEVPLLVRLERRPLGDRSVFVAWLQPASQRQV